MIRRNNRYTYEEVKYYIEIESNTGYKLLSTTYERCTDKLDVMCDKGHIFHPTFRNFLHCNSRCSVCFGKNKYKYKEVKKIFEDEGCILLTKKYINNSQLLDYICSCGNKSSISLTNFLAGHRCNICGQQKRIETNLQKYGVEYTSQNKEVRQKQLESLYKNGTQKTSSQQKYIHDLLGGELNYPFNLLSLDIAFPDKMIYLEYDGGFHNGRVQCGLLTEEEFVEKERKRSCLLSDNGWREIRIISLSDKLPSDKTIKEIYKYAINYINFGHSWIKFDIDNSKVINSIGEFNYNYGELKTI